MEALFLGMLFLSLATFPLPSPVTKPKIVYVVAGQSLAAGSAHQRSACRNPYASSGFLQPDGLVHWQHCSDPQYQGGYRFLNPILENYEIAGAKARGSWVPFLGDKLATKDTPVGFINVAVGASSILDWQPGRPAHQKLMAALKHQPRAVLWEQGLTDAGMTTEEYAMFLRRLIRSCRDAGWQGDFFVALESSSTSIRQAQFQVIASGLAQQGPDIDKIEDREEDGVHLNWEGNRKAANGWSGVVQRK